MNRPRLATPCLLLTLLLLVGCQNGQDGASAPTTPATAQPSPTPTVTATAATPSPTATAVPTDADPTADWVRCENEQDGYSVAHPPAWETNQGSVLPACSLFDPDDVEVERGTEIPFDIAVAIRVEPVEMERIAETGSAEEELDREDATVDGREAVRREVESTGEALRPAGLRSTLWLVAIDDDQTLVAVTHDAGDPEYGDKQEVLDRMVESLQLDGE